MAPSEIKDEHCACVPPGEIPPAFARWTTAVLSRVAEKMRRTFEAKVQHLGLRSKHYGALILLESGPMTQVELGRGMAIDRTTMVSLVDDLSKLGLVERAPNPADRRAHAVTLTEEGRKVRQMAAEAVDATQEEILAPLTAEEREQLRNLLSKLL